MLICRKTVPWAPDEHGVVVPQVPFSYHFLYLHLFVLMCSSLFFNGLHILLSFFFFIFLSGALPYRFLSGRVILLDQAHMAGETNSDSRERKGYWQLLESRLVIRGFLGGPLAKAPYSQCRGARFNS